MRRLAGVVVALAAAAGAEAVLSRHLPAVAEHLDFFLMVSLYHALASNQVTGMLAGCGAGLVQDALSAHPVGLNAFAKTAIGYLVGGLGTRLELQQPVPQALCLAGAIPVQAGIVAVVRLVLGIPAEWPGAVALTSRALATAVVGATVYAVLRRRRAQRRRAQRR